MHSLSVMRAAVVALIAIASTGSVSHARAATFIVNSTADDPPGPCETVAGGCTLREAIIASVANPGRDTIRLRSCRLSARRAREIQLGAALPAIADPAGTIVDGAGAGVAIEQEFNGGGTTPIHGLLFATARVAARQCHRREPHRPRISGRGRSHCGGVPPDCQEPVTGTTSTTSSRSENVEDGHQDRGPRRHQGAHRRLGRDEERTTASRSTRRRPLPAFASNAARRTTTNAGIPSASCADISDTAITDSIATHDRPASRRRDSAGREDEAHDLGAVNNRARGSSSTRSGRRARRDHEQRRIRQHVERHRGPRRRGVGCRHEGRRRATGTASASCRRLHDRDRRQDHAGGGGRQRVRRHRAARARERRQDHARLGRRQRRVGLRVIGSGNV